MSTLDPIILSGRKKGGKMLAKGKEDKWGELISPYEGKYVALSPDETQVVGVGDRLEEVIKEAKKKGIKDPVVTTVPPKDRSCYY